MMTVFYTQSYAQKTLCNGSLYLDGTDDFGRISSSFFDTIPNQSTFTIEFYIKLGNNPTRYPAVWSQYGNGTYMGIYPCSGVRMVYKNTNTYGTDSAGIRQGTWEHYAITGDGPTSKLNNKILLVASRKYSGKDIFFKMTYVKKHLPINFVLITR